MKKEVAAKAVLMVSPARFSFNPEAGESNSFQKKADNLSSEEIQRLSIEEFNELVNRLTESGIEILKIIDTDRPHKPDAIFPNNWFSTHSDRSLILYPMANPNRRVERRDDVIEILKDRFGFNVEDLSHYETGNTPLFLEGTGSMVIDHENDIIYAARSIRTSEELLTEFAVKKGMRTIVFDAFGKTNEPIYHTNVMLCIGEGFAVIGTETIATYDRDRVITTLEKGGKEIIELTSEQVYKHFAGNMLQLKNKNGERILAMSERAFRSLTKDQIKLLEKYNNKLLYSPIPTIEQIGGGSVRCMLAELFVS